MMAVVSTDEGAPIGEPAEAISLRQLYVEQRWTLVRLASLLIHDRDQSEEVVQDVFVNAYLAWDRISDPSRALAYLRSAVLNGARSRLRHLRVVERNPAARSASPQSPEAAVMAGEEHRMMITVLRSLPRRQAECLVLRFYLDLSEAETASTLGISPGSVKTHVHRGLAALAIRLGDRR
jgi:RNA polymerase sigma-70 factor (sigma-E family)